MTKGKEILPAPEAVCARMCVISLRAHMFLCAVGECVMSAHSSVQTHVIVTITYRQVEVHSGRCKHDLMTS